MLPRAFKTVNYCLICHVSLALSLYRRGVLEYVINDVKLFPTVYRRMYCRKYLTLSNQTSRYNIKCIRKNRLNETEL